MLHVGKEFLFFRRSLFLKGQVCWRKSNGETKQEFWHIKNHLHHGRWFASRSYDCYYLYALLYKTKIKSAYVNNHLAFKLITINLDKCCACNFGCLWMFTLIHFPTGSLIAKDKYNLLFDCLVLHLSLVICTVNCQKIQLHLSSLSPFSI